MQLYNTTLPHKSLIHEIWNLCDAGITSYPIKDVIRRLNSSFEQVVGWLINASGTWQWDDTNYTDLPIGTQTLVAGQSAYTFNDKFLTIERVKIKNKNGDWVIIKPLDQAEISNETVLEEYFETAGMPEYYDKISDDTFKLYPAPSAAQTTLASGLKVEYRRTAKVYTMSDSTTITSGEESVEPGFASPYHVILAYMASVPFCMNYKKDRVNLYEKKITELKDELVKHYSKRQKDERKGFSMKPISFR